MICFEIRIGDQRTIIKGLNIRAEGPLGRLSADQKFIEEFGCGKAIKRCAVSKWCLSIHKYQAHLRALHVLTSSMQGWPWLEFRLPRLNRPFRLVDINDLEIYRRVNTIDLRKIDLRTIDFSSAGSVEEGTDLNISAFPSLQANS